MRAAGSDAGRHRGLPRAENLNHPLADGAGEIRLLRRGPDLELDTDSHSEWRYVSCTSEWRTISWQCASELQVSTTA